MPSRSQRDISPATTAPGTTAGPSCPKPTIRETPWLVRRECLIEGQSRNTAENARLTRDLLEGQGEASLISQTGPPWVLVTSAFHMPRAVASFDAAGWRNLTPWPTDFRGGVFWGRTGWNLGRNLEELSLGAKEWVGLIAYRLTGRAR